MDWDASLGVEQVEKTTFCLAYLLFLLLYLYLKSYALGYIVYNAIWHLGSLKVQPANFQLKDLMRSSYKKLNDNFSLNVLEFNFFLVQT